MYKIIIRGKKNYFLMIDCMAQFENTVEKSPIGLFQIKFSLYNTVRGFSKIFNKTVCFALIGVTIVSKVKKLKSIILHS